MNTARVRYISIMLAIAGILFGCSPKPPRYGVVHFGNAKFSADEQGIENDSCALWKERNQHITLVHFRSQGGGKWAPLGFTLKGPDGEEHLPHYFKQGSDREWQIAFHPKRGLNGICINQIRGDLDLFLLFPIKQKPSTSYRLTYAMKDCPEREFKILPGALDKEE